MNVINSVASDGVIEVHRTIESFSRRLRQPVRDIEVAVIVASSRKELNDILKIGELVRDIRIILILPDRKHETLSIAYKLYPRYVSDKDSDFKDVAAVLNKMKENVLVNKKI